MFNNTLFYKEKYLKYKNKYLILKNQAGGFEFNNTNSIIFYNNSEFPQLQKIKDNYITAMNSDSLSVLINEKNVNVNEFIKQQFNIPLPEINGRSSIYQYHLNDDKIIPAMYLYIESKLIWDLINSPLSSKNDAEKKELTQMLSNFKENYKKFKQLHIKIDKSIGKISPLYDGRLNIVTTKLINLINNNNSKERIDAYNNMIQNKQIWDKHFKEFGPNLPDSQIEKFLQVDSFMVVKQFSTDDKGIHFTIDSFGNTCNSISSVPENAPTQENASTQENAPTQENAQDNA